MVPSEALKIALTKEKASVKLYEKLSAKYPEIKDLLSFLITEEQKHVAMIEKEIARLMRG